MPANLPPPYFEAEKRYRSARTAEEKIEALEEMLTIMPKHKGTDKLRADLRRRIAKTKTEAQQKKGLSKRDVAYSIEREGAAQIVLVGAPNTGKSSLLAALSNAKPEIADFPHSTWKPTPGMVPYENIQFQMVDTPPITREYVDPWMADLLRRADILAILLDLHADPLQQMEDTLIVLRDLRIYRKGEPIPADLKKSPFIKKIILILNKMDDEQDEEDYKAFLELAETDLPCVGVSVLAGRNLHGLLQELYGISEIIRVYTKAPGKEPDFRAPFVLPGCSPLEDLAVKIHKDFVDQLKFAKVWGKTVFDGQMVQRDHILQDGDIVEMHI